MRDNYSHVDIEDMQLNIRDIAKKEELNCININTEIYETMTTSPNQRLPHHKNHVPQYQSKELLTFEDYKEVMVKRSNQIRDEEVLVTSPAREIRNSREKSIEDKSLPQSLRNKSKENEFQNKHKILIENKLICASTKHYPDQQWNKPSLLYTSSTKSNFHKKDKQTSNTTSIETQINNVRSNRYGKSTIGFSSRETKEGFEDLSPDTERLNLIQQERLIKQEKEDRENELKEIERKKIEELQEIEKNKKGWFAKQGKKGKKGDKTAESVNDKQSEVNKKSDKNTEKTSEKLTEKNSELSVSNKGWLKGSPTSKTHKASSTKGLVKKNSETSSITNFNRKESGIYNLNNLDIKKGEINPLKINQAIQAQQAKIEESNKFEKEYSSDSKNLDNENLDILKEDFNNKTKYHKYSNLKQIKKKFARNNEQDLRYKIVREYSHLKLKTEKDFLQRMAFDSFKRIEKPKKIEEMVNEHKVKIKESSKIQTFNRLIDDANRRIESQLNSINLNNVNTHSKIDDNEGSGHLATEGNLTASHHGTNNAKKYKKKEWDDIYEDRFKTYEDKKKSKIDKKLEEKKIKRLKEEEQILESEKQLKANSEFIKNVVTRMNNDAERRKVGMDKKFKINHSQSFIVSKSSKVDRVLADVTDIKDFKKSKQAKENQYIFEVSYFNFIQALQSDDEFKGNTIEYVNTGGNELNEYNSITKINNNHSYNTFGNKAIKLDNSNTLTKKKNNKAKSINNMNNLSSPQQDVLVYQGVKTRKNDRNSVYSPNSISSSKYYQNNSNISGSKGNVLANNIGILDRGKI